MQSLQQAIATQKANGNGNQTCYDITLSNIDQSIPAIDGMRTDLTGDPAMDAVFISGAEAQVIFMFQMYISCGATAPAPVGKKVLKICVW